MTTVDEIDIRDALLGGRSLQVVCESGVGVIVGAVPDFKSGRGLLCTVALGAETFEEGRKFDRDRLIDINEYQFKSVSVAPS